MDNQIIDLLNELIKSQLPTINAGIQAEITSNHLDPWGQVANGSDNFGSINLGICHASASADYHVKNLCGLSSFTIMSFTINDLWPDPNDPLKLTGSVSLSASLSSDLSARLGGGFTAKCGFVHKSVDISGKATAKGTTANASGTFTASADGGNVCLNTVKIHGTSINYDSIQVKIDGLGIFNDFLSALTDVFIGLFRGPIRDAIASAITPAINDQVAKVLPICHKF